jgi:hypothetical protein
VGMCSPVGMGKAWTKIGAGQGGAGAAALCRGGSRSARRARLPSSHRLPPPLPHSVARQARIPRCPRALLAICVSQRSIRSLASHPHPHGRAHPHLRAPKEGLPEVERDTTDMPIADVPSSATPSSAQPTPRPRRAHITHSRPPRACACAPRTSPHSRPSSARCRTRTRKRDIGVDDAAEP